MSVHCGYLPLNKLARVMWLAFISILSINASEVPSTQGQGKGIHEDIVKMEIDRNVQ